MMFTAFRGIKLAFQMLCLSLKCENKHTEGLSLLWHN